MRVDDTFEYATTNLQKRSLRSWLTVIGIVIGVFAIIIIVSLAQGLDNYIRNQLSGLGENMIFVEPGKVTASTFGGFLGAMNYFTQNELDAIGRLPEVELASGEVAGRAEVQYRSQQSSFYVAGEDPRFVSEINTYQLESGRWPQENELGVAVIGDGIANDVFDQPITLGRRIFIGNKSFTVIGVITKGNGLTSSIDNMILVQIKDARDVIPEFQGTSYLDELHIKVVPGTNVSDAAEHITETLLTMRKLRADDQDFSTMTAATISQEVGNITAALGLFLAGIAAVSLLVGSIGIANTMFMSVMERTKEIGVMKAVGATPGMIMGIFLIESGIIGVVGGFLGLLASVCVSYAISYFGVPSNVTWWVALSAVLFSFAVGVVAGYVPARNAAKLDPVEALRFE